MTKALLKIIMGTVSKTEYVLQSELLIELEAPILYVDYFIIGAKACHLVKRSIRVAGFYR